MFRKDLFWELLRENLGSVRGNFRGGRKPFPKPSAFESEIYPPHKTSFCTLGISPLQGADSCKCELRQYGRRTANIHAAQRTGRMDGAASQKSLCDCQKGTAVNRPDKGMGLQTAALWLLITRKLQQKEAGKGENIHI